jgi:quinol monooxygenase YgiN
MTQIAVLAKLTCQPGMADEVATGLAPMLAHVENEPGTLRYVLHRDSGNDDVLWFYEVYADQAGFDAHGSSSAMKELGHALAGKLAGRPELIFLTPLGGKGL